MPNFKRHTRLACAALALSLLILPILGSVSAKNDLPLPGESQEITINTGHTVTHVYYSANCFSTIIGCLENNTRLTVLGETKDFYRIDCHDMKGYLPKEQVRQDENGEYYVNCNPDSIATTVLGSYNARTALSLRGQLRAFSMQYVGVPYASGGTTPRGFDCSGFTQYVYAGLDIPIYRSVAAQLQNGVIISKEDLQCGDLIFFQNTTGWGHFASHVGIYIGNGQMIHSGNGGVAVVNLEHAYFTYHYMCARRIILSDLPQESTVPTFGINRNMNSSYWRESSQTDPSGNFFI